MRVRCLHGYFIFDELKLGQITDFTDLTGFDLTSIDNYYTFTSLLDAPDFSLKAKPILGVTAIATFEGSPWEVFKKNKIVYNFNKDLVVPIATITQVVTLDQVGNKYLSPGLIMPGSLNVKGQRVTGYAAWFSQERQTWKYTEVTYG